VSNYYMEMFSFGSSEMIAIPYFASGSIKVVKDE
jgi:hypothetical protein